MNLTYTSYGGLVDVTEHRHYILLVKRNRFWDAAERFFHRIFKATDYDYSIWSRAWEYCMNKGDEKEIVIAKVQVSEQDYLKVFPNNIRVND